MSAAAIVAAVRGSGRSIHLDGADIVIRPPLMLDVLAEVRTNKDEIVAELRREAAVLEYAAKKGLIDAEWRLAGCETFTALERADEAAEASYGACLSCGGSIELHGSPDASTWRRVASLDDIQIAAVRYILASAGAIERQARQ